MSTAPQPEPPVEIAADPPSRRKLASSMVLAWAAIGGFLGYCALAGGTIARASGIAWFAAAGAALALVATGIGRAFRGENPSWNLIRGGALTGGVAFASLAAWTLGRGWGGAVAFSLIGMATGGVLGFCGSVLALAAAEHGPLRLLWWILRGRDGR